MEMVMVFAAVGLAYGAGVFVGYIMGYDKGDRDNNAGRSTRTAF